MIFNTSAVILAGLTGFFRLAEIAYGEIKTISMRKDGGKEYASWQRWPIFVTYGLWLALLPIFVLKGTQVNLLFLGIYVLMQVLRWWGIAHLGKYWTTRIMIVPGGTLIKTGPYLLLPHPIYIALLGEVIALSLTFDQYALASFFGGLTALWIFFRIRAENAALAQLN